MFFIFDYLAYNFPSIVQIVKSAVKMRQIEQALKIAPGCLEKRIAMARARIYFRMLCFRRCLEKYFTGGYQL
jgi:hypothetical protein